ncbi:MAG: NTP transferase domain-containing protein [Acidobacteria bacterium]|nr:NTP transferase domain-containing protein [Acidobacteriota bacterium]
MNAVIVIPARYDSTRFPGKPLAPIAGKTLIRRVYERVSSSSVGAGVWVATDDERIADHVESFGGRAVMTSRDHPSGTDRIAEASADALGRDRPDLSVQVVVAVAVAIMATAVSHWVDSDRRAPIRDMIADARRAAEDGLTGTGLPRPV